MKNLKQEKVKSDVKKYRTSNLLSTRTLKHFAVLLVFGILVVENCSFSVCSAQPSAQAKSDTVRLGFVSDTQDPLFIDRLYSSYNENAEARELIFENIIAFKPMAVIHLGDEISIGSKNATWRDIDRFVGNLHKEDIEFSPIPGNHEYLLVAKTGVAHFTSRYPYAKLTGYSRQYGDVVVVLFNSNFEELSKKEKQDQFLWYQHTLSQCENDSSVSFVVVGCHHPPFTNSKIVSWSKEVRDDYLPEYYGCKKCVLFLSGHSHAYEHFKISGKDFLVIGGGGGTQHTLRTGAKAEFKDVFSDSLKRRMFHFLTMKSCDDTLRVDLNMLKPDFKDFERLPQLIFVRYRTITGESVK
jgi:hypothetical protein